MSIKKSIAIAFSITLMAIAFSWNADSQEDGKPWVGRVAAAYEGFSSYQFEGSIRSETSGFSKSSTNISFARLATPSFNRFRYQAGIADSRFVASSDGNETWIYFGGVRKYMSRKTQDSAAVLRDVFKGDIDPYLGHGLPDDYATLPERLNKAAVIGRESIRLPSAQIDCIVVEVELKRETSLPKTESVRRLWIDPATLVVLRDLVHIKAFSSKGTLFYEASDDLKVSSSRINAEIPESLFQFEPPPGARVAESLILPENDRGKLAGLFVKNIPLTDLNDRKFQMNDLRGKVVILDFWATWCVPCVKQMRLLEKAYQKNRNNHFEFFGVNKENGKLQSDFLRKKRFSYTMLYDLGGVLSRSFNASELPTTIIIDRQGKIVEWERGIYGPEELNRLLALLAVP